ncbi:putative cinnamoyl-CoA reductase [Xylaria palmicola]|nr:putative cinnamoyl-CoA reductase [Xylaria palmicola]
MSSHKLLITGATGFIGFHVLLRALEEGWVVRAAVRSAAKSESISKHPKIADAGLASRLSFVEVPDICAENAYDEAIKGVTHVVHLASPLPSPFLDPLTGIYEPNIRSVNSILSAALKERGLKKLVITSSVFGNSPFPPDPTKHITADVRVQNLAGPFTSMMPAYWGGKIAATNAVDAWAASLKDTHPSLSLSVVFPGFVFGRDLRATGVDNFKASTNRILLALITGATAPAPMPAGAVDVHDAALVHILALRDDAPRNIGATVPHVFEDAWGFIAKHYPKAVESGVFTKGSQATIPVNWDASKTESDFPSFKFKSWEDMVVETAGQFLELSGKEKA